MALNEPECLAVALSGPQTTMVAWDPTGLPYMFTQPTGGEAALALFELGSLNGCSGTLCLIPTVPASCGVG